MTQKDKDFAERSLNEEEQAIQDYSQRLKDADSDDLKEIIRHARSEEHDHAQMFGSFLAGGKSNRKEYNDNEVKEAKKMRGGE